MTDENPARDAADNLYERLSDHTDDVLDETCADGRDASGWAPAALRGDQP